ncbi:MAG: serine hydrolase [Chloroflexia bacterium]
MSLQRVYRVVLTGRRSFSGRLFLAFLLLLLAGSLLGLRPFSPSAGLSGGAALARGVVPALYSAAPEVPDPKLQAIVNDVVGDQPGTWGVAVKKLDTGQFASYNLDTQQVSASLYKLWVLAELYRQDRTGSVSIDGPSGLRPYAEPMIQYSSNEAAIYLVNILGPGNVNATMHNIGLRNSVLNWNFTGDNLTTPRDVMTILQLMATSRLVDSAASQDMINIMLDQTINNLLPQGIPFGTPFAHKTGTLDYLLHDAGIVYGPAGPYLIVSMSSDLPSYYGATLTHIELSRRVYNYLSAPPATGPFRYFAQTGQSAGHGFLKYWNSHGSLDTFGYPISGETSRNGVTVQWFQRARLEWHSEAPGWGSDVEPNVLLGLVGSERAAQLGLHWPAQASTGRGLYFQRTGQEITDDFLHYWQEHGGAQIFGYPISPASNMVNPVDGKTYLTQWFQRARFELHPEVPGGPKVLLGTLGQELLNAR